MDGVLACRAYANAAQSFIHHKHLIRAKVAILRGKSFAKFKHQRAFEAGFVVLEAQVNEALGDHATAAKALITLLKSPLSACMLPRHKVLLFRSLAAMCSVTDPGDSLDLCISLARRAWPASEGLLPLHWYCAEAEYRLWQFFWSDPRFKTRLRSLQLQPDRRRQLLAQAGSALGMAEQACARDADERHNMRVVQACRELLSALETNVAEPALSIRITRSTQSGAPGHNALSLLNTAYAMHILGRPDLARDALVAMMPQMLEQSHWHTQLEHVYLQSITAEALGDAAAAFRLYQAYATEMAAKMQHMELGMRNALKTLSSVPGGRPQDLPDQLPGYLRRAMLLLEQDPISIDIRTLAQAVGVGERTLRSAFNVHCKMAPKAYATQVRLDAARRYLEASRHERPTVTEVAERFGFSNASRFAAAYRKRHGNSLRDRSDAP